MPLRTSEYRGRFAPSPTGALHAGSLVAALASWLDARAHGGTWLLRIEDLDPPREVPGAAQHIIDTLAALGMTTDEPVLLQSTRSDAYAEALARLQDRGAVFACTCSRRDVLEAGGNTQRYPGTCRERPAHKDRCPAWRLRVTDAPIGFVDRAQGHFEQRLESAVGDFVVQRADRLWAYQLAVVVDDAAQRVSDVVRGADLLDNTPRQLWLQHVLQLPQPRYLHVPVVTNAAGEKLSKQTGAQPLDRMQPKRELERAWQHLGFDPLGADTVPAFLRTATLLWRERWAIDRWAID
jgi:glutamyl-Q tRNA(Asp) synthetase